MEASHARARSLPRPLLPRPPQAEGPALATSTQLVPRKPHTRVACELCRGRKIKCDGKRPACSGCMSNGDNCHYFNTNPDESRSSAVKRKLDETQDRLTRHEELYSLISSRSRPEVSEIIRRLRTGSDVDSVLRYVKDGDLLLQLHLEPEARLRYTFPDFASWPILFSDPDDPYLKTQLLDFDADTRSDGATTPDSTTGADHVYEVPYHGAQLIDPRLHSVKAATWTTVTTDDALVSNLLTIYFQFEYPSAPFLPKDLFLDDLVRGHTKFCSSLLVNIILANAAHGLASDPQRAQFWIPQSLPYAFLVEAKRLWDLETIGEPKLMTIQAALILSMRYGADGADKIALPFLFKAFDLAQEMALFTGLEKGDTKMSLARTFTAWTLFSWLSISFSFQLKVPLVTKPPATPLPDYATITRLTGEMYLKYPLQPTLTPIHLGHAFKAQVELNTIMNEINNACCCAGKPGTSPPSVQQAVEFYEELDKWYNSLPEALQPSRVAMPHHIHLHMLYCLVVINLLAPWTSDLESTVTINNHSLQELATIARARLETLTRLYYLRHSFDALDTILVMYLLLLGSISVRIIGGASDSDSDSDTPNPLTSTFLLCAKGLHDQGRNAYLGALMFDVLSGLVDPANKALVVDLARIRGEFRGVEVKPENVHMSWPVYRWVHPENERMGRLLEGVEALEIGEGEVTDGESVSSRGATPVVR